MGGIQLHLVRYRCRARWRRVERLPHQSRGVWIRIGELASGGWFLDVIKPDGDECWPAPDEQTARDWAAQWMGRFGGDWEQVPCYPTHGWQLNRR